MMEFSKIEWTDHTFNPWIGCTKVSDGCKNCYAEALMDKRYGKVEWGVQGKRVRTSADYWKQPLRWNRQAQKDGKRAKVFCASLADVFEIKPDQPELDDWRWELFRIIQETPWLDWLLLTKRPESVTAAIERCTYVSDASLWLSVNPVWIGTSVENQEQADIRIPELLKIPARVRFLSMEPLLGAVDLDAAGAIEHDSTDGYPELVHIQNSLIDWVIVGGESGPNARPMHPNWARSIRDQCQAANIPFFFKQWGEWLPRGQHFSNGTLNGGLPHASHDPKWDCVGSGRLLDFVEHNEFPDSV